MDIKKYLHIQFETYPRLFRDVVAFLSKDSVVNALMNVPNEINSKNATGDKLTLREKTTKAGVRYVYENEDGSLTSGGLQRSPSIAYWNWFAKKETPLLDSVPLMKEDVFVARYQKWAKLTESESILQHAAWVASVKWAKNTWSAHRKSKDYMLLDDSEQVYVDTIGAALDVIRKQAALLSKISGLDVTEKSNVSILIDADNEVRRERTEYYPVYQSRLSPTFRFKVKELLSVN